MRKYNNEEIQITLVSDLSKLSRSQLNGAINTYQKAFRTWPYNEKFTNMEAKRGLQYILDKDGDLVIGQAEDSVISLAGGYMKEDGKTYYIEELAVRPDYQERGIGRFTLRALLNKAYLRDPDAIEIRTTKRNNTAINLYKSEGFVDDANSEVVAGIRQDGCLALDERIYLLKKITNEVIEKPKKLKRAAIVYPSGNTTAVVFDQLLNTERGRLNGQVMEAWKQQADGEPEIEQCCFVTLPKNKNAVARVEMFGGEFCGNATRSAIKLITKGQDYQGLIEVSGVDRPLNFSIVGGEITIEMPLPQTGELAKTVDEGTLVQLDGIAQLVVTGDKQQSKYTPRELLQSIILMDKYSLSRQPAVGICYYDQTSNKAEFCVWVKQINTYFDETACGSGTSAIGISIATLVKQSQRLDVIQPSGEIITTEAILDDDKREVIYSSIAGAASVLYDGELVLS